ncbi:hypothetical protein [Planctomycetes bacterium K23_9]|uniref:Uncharacterized protein n=1 Tax=Stieleria marina TaxID=1930275 RepID=A0A517NWC6_9BACT|nr:hypothetical protein K239x_34320 [Planctomycetes bacterium K23_9]
MINILTPQTRHGVFGTLATLGLLFPGCSNNQLAGSSSQERDLITQTAFTGDASNKVSATDRAIAKATSDEDATSESNATPPPHAATPQEFPDDVNFFMPPRTSEPTLETVVSTADHRHSVRLIGFANATPGDPTRKAAILKINDKLIRLGVNESHDGVTLLAIQDRAVTLQSGRERITMTLMGQEIVNQPSRHASRHLTRRATTQRNRRRTPTRSELRPAQSESPLARDIPVDPARIPEPPTLPEDPPELRMPEMPDLPDLEGVPGV